MRTQIPIRPTPELTTSVATRRADIPRAARYMSGAMPSRLRPTRVEYVVDGVRLRSLLSAAALDAGGDAAEQRRRAIEILKGALFRGRMIAKERLENGAGGLETARLLAGVTDEVITALFDFATGHVLRVRNPTAGERLTLDALFILRGPGGLDGGEKFIGLGTATRDGLIDILQRRRQRFRR